MFRVLVAQACVCIALSVVLILTQGWVAAYSVFLGGSIVWLANAYFTYKAFKYYGARSILAIVQSFWAGQIGKMILTAALFALVFVAVKPLSVVFLFVGYILIQSISVGSLLVMKGL